MSALEQVGANTAALIGALGGALFHATWGMWGLAALCLFYVALIAFYARRHIKGGAS